MDTELIKAFVIAGHSDLEKVRAMLAEYPDLLNQAFEWRPGDFEDALAAAAHIGTRDVAEYLLQQGAPFTLYAAAMLGRIDDVRAFLDADPTQVNGRGAHGIPLMYHAVLSGNLELVKLLRERGCTTGYDHALHAAITQRLPQMVEWLLHNGVTDVNTPDYQMKTPLKRAQETNQPEIAAMLEAYQARLEI
ncbi:MAG: ankyrin repeat domain-containing protein [bacterium]|nr:ankyrin repeat domain-containing protein [bacterium]